MTPKIEKTEEFDLTTNCDKLPQSFSTPNCEICKDYPKEYWCGNPKNKLSTPNEEQLKEMDKAFERQSDENEDYKEW